MKWYKATLGGAVVLGCVGITVAAFLPHPPPATEVEVASAKKAQIKRVVAGAGKLESATTVKISSNLSGDLMELLVKEGDRVQKGQVLARIDKRIFEASARQALAGQSAARADAAGAQVEVSRTDAELKRTEALAQKGLASSADVEKALADRDGAVARLGSAKEHFAQAVAQYEQAKNSLDKTTLVSPIDGSVIEKSREIGERVRGSDLSEDVVMTLAALSRMEVKIEVSEHDVVYLKPGQRADVKLDALEGQTFEGTVSEIAQKALIKNPGTEQEVVSFPVKVALTARPPGALPGMNSEVRIIADTHEDALLVPIQAVTVRASKSLPDAHDPVEGKVLSAPAPDDGLHSALAKVVFVIDQAGKARLRRVRTGIASDTQLEILEGLAPGDRVIEGPYRTIAKELKEGDPVKEKVPEERSG